MITRRALGGLAAASMVFPAGAAENGTFVSGWGLPTNLDPHQIFDVPMQTVMLNAYDGLYRYQNDPPELVPWLASSHTVSDDGLTWDFKLRPGIASTTAVSSPRMMSSTVFTGCWRCGWRRPERSCRF